jgi:translation initiation factor IF-1
MMAGLVARAVVTQVLPSQRYRMELEDGRRVAGTVPAEARGRLGAIRVGDRLQVEISPFDRGHVRILGVAGPVAPGAGS